MRRRGQATTSPERLDLIERAEACQSEGDFVQGRYPPKEVSL